ncbi:MAG: hypothetical protein MUE83_09995 [Tabrizicola sp.]|jgi:hypothetical protein|nr:hypothetical protein [Tabrizicola sp.]
MNSSLNELVRVAGLCNLLLIGAPKQRNLALVRFFLNACNLKPREGAMVASRSEVQNSLEGKVYSNAFLLGHMPNAGFIISVDLPSTVRFDESFEVEASLQSGKRLRGEAVLKDHYGGTKGHHTSLYILVLDDVRRADIEDLSSLTIDRVSFGLEGGKITLMNFY